LIELALAIPVFIAIIYYLHDISKYARMKERMNFATHCAVGLIQNISANRINKKVTFDDIKYAMTSSFLAFFPAATQYATANISSIECAYPLGYFPIVYVHCVVGNSDGTKASVVWGKHAFTDSHFTGGRDGSDFTSTNHRQRRGIFKGCCSVQNTS
jgi:Flp pilus assembly protein TadG